VPAACGREARPASGPICPNHTKGPPPPARERRPPPPLGPLGFGPPPPRAYRLPRQSPTAPSRGPGPQRLPTRECAGPTAPFAAYCRHIYPDACRSSPPPTRGGPGPGRASPGRDINHPFQPRSKHLGVIQSGIPPASCLPLPKPHPPSVRLAPPAVRVSWVLSEQQGQRLQPAPGSRSPRKKPLCPALFNLPTPPFPPALWPAGVTKSRNPPPAPPIPPCPHGPRTAGPAPLPAPALAARIVSCGNGCGRWERRRRAPRVDSVCRPTDRSRGPS